MSIQTELEARNVKLQGILDDTNAAITAKGGTQAATLSDLPEAVGAIEGGKAFSPYDDVCFYDYDGTLLYSCTLAEANAMTKLPAIPDHSGDPVPLTSCGWNYTLEEVNALNRKADIGAIYNPTDGKTHFTLRMDEFTGLTCTTQFYMYAGGTMHVDWGDGTVETNATATSYSAYLTHTYAQAGTYNVTIWCEGSTWTPYKQCLCNEAPVAIVGTVVFGTDVSCFWLGGMMQKALSEAGAEYIVWPNLYDTVKDFTSTPPQNSPVSNMPFLKHFNIPRNAQTAPTFQNCCQLKRVSVPETATCAGDYFCSGSYVMDRLCLPDGWINNYTGTNSKRFLLEQATVTEWTYHFAPAYRDLHQAYTLRKLTVLGNVTSVDGNLWCQNCPLEEIWLYPTTPPTLSSTNSMFQKIRKNAVIYVPAESLEAYKTATNWSTFADRFRPMEDAT